jgi:hypothetical protein
MKNDDIQSNRPIKVLDNRVKSVCCEKWESAFGSSVPKSTYIVFFCFGSVSALDPEKNSGS